MKKISTKKIICIVIFVILIFLIIDFKIDILSRDNWVDIIIGAITFLGSSILSILIINQTYKLDEKNKKIEIEIFNKQIDLDLRERRLNIYSSFMSLGVTSMVNNSDYFVLNFIGGNCLNNERRLNDIINKEQELVIALHEAKLLFKDNEKLLENLSEIQFHFTMYRWAIQSYLDKEIYAANDEVIGMLNKDKNITVKSIPEDLIRLDKDEYLKCKDIFYNHYEKAKKEEITLFNLINDDNLQILFDKLININKIEEVKDETEIQTSTISR